MADDIEQLRLQVLQKRVAEKRAMEDANFVAHTEGDPQGAIRGGNTMGGGGGDASVRPDPKASYLESLGQGFTQGATFGFGDEIGAAGGAALAKILPNSMGGSSQSYGQLYNEELNAQRKNTAQATEANPYTYNAAELGGAAVSPLAKAGMIGSAAGGAAQAVGSSTHNIMNGPGDAMALGEEALIGAGKGLLTHGAVKGVGAVGSALLPDALDRLAQIRGLKAVFGQNKAAFKQAAKLNQTERIGQDITQASEELGGQPLVRFGEGVESIKNRAAEGADKAWQKVSSIYKTIDGRTDGQSIKSGDLANAILDRAKKIMPIPRNKPMIDRLTEEAAWMENQPNMSLERAQQLKNNYVFKMADPHSHALGLDGNNAIRDAYAKTIAGTVENLGSKAEQNTFKRSMSNFGSFSTAAGRAGDREVANISNRFISPSDYATGIAGGLANAVQGGDLAKSGLWGTALSIGHKIARERGSSMVSATARNASNAMKTPVVGQALQMPARAMAAAPNLPVTPALSQLWNSKKPKDMVPTDTNIYGSQRFNIIGGQKRPINP